MNLTATMKLYSARVKIQQQKSVGQKELNTKNIELNYEMLKSINSEGGIKQQLLAERQSFF